MKPRAFWIRASAAFFLFVGFYVLSFSLVVGLCVLVYYQLRYGLRSSGFALFGAAAAGLGAVWIAYAIFPRRVKVYEGARFDPKSEPELHKLITRVAHRVGQSAPDIVYLIESVNAFAGTHGGVLGIGSKRVVGIGLPLLSTLSESELSAVLAHEFGHHVGGEVRFGPWIHRTRRTIALTLDRLSEAFFWVKLPFQLYGDLFLKITTPIARAQEFQADRFAATHFGEDVTADALVRIDELAGAWDVYWFDHVVPALLCGFHPPVLSGFSDFLAERSRWPDEISDTIRRYRKREPRRDDTHPPLADRVLALCPDRVRASLMSPRHSHNPKTSIRLRDSQSFEAGIVNTLVVHSSGKLLQACDWRTAAREGALLRWSRQLEKADGRVYLLEVAKLPQALSTNAIALQDGLNLMSEAGWKKRAREMAIASLGLSLIDAGARFEGGPGRALLLRAGDELIDVEREIDALVSRSVEELEWQNRFARWTSSCNMTEAVDS